MTPRVSRYTFVAAAMSVMMLVTPAAAQGHSAFLGSDPEPGKRLETAPRQVTLNFTEPLNAGLGSVKVYAAHRDRRLAVAIRTQRGRRLVVIPKRRLPTGGYRLVWHTVSTQDGHALEGSFSFGVRAPAGGTEHAVEASPLARHGWVRVALRGLLYVFVLLFVAALLLPRLVAYSGDSWLVPETLGADDRMRRLRDHAGHLVADLGWLATAGAVGTALAEAADAAGSLSPQALRDFLLSNLAGVARVAVVVLLAGATVLWRRAPRAAAAAGVLALGSIAASGHAASASPRLPSVLNDWLHLTSGAAWLGGMGLIVLVWGSSLGRIGRAGRLGVAREVLVPFGRVALPAFVLVSTTGLVSLLTELGRLSALWKTGYGQLLAVKIGIVGLIAAASAVHALRLRPRLLSASSAADSGGEHRHWGLVRAEPLLGLGVLAAVAVLVAFPLPPRQVGEADEARAAGLATADCDPCPLPRARADELPVAAGAGSKLVAAWVRREPGAVSGVVRVIDFRGRPDRRPYRVVGTRARGCGSGCERFLIAASQPLLVRVRDRGRRYTVRLPTRWRVGGSSRARRLLNRAQRSMRGLRSVREIEQVTSGAGSFARTVYRLRAPDRMALKTGRGVQAVTAGTRQFTRIGSERWRAGSYGSGLRFRTRTWFRFTTYARSVRLLGVRRVGGRRGAELALMDEGTPVWMRLTVDLATGRVLTLRMATKAHFMRSRFDRVNQPTTIRLPRVG